MDADEIIRKYFKKHSAIGMIYISFFLTIIRLVMGYISTKDVPVFSCVYLPELFVDLENICLAEYECWNSQLRDYSRYFLFKQFGIYRSNVATATCDSCEKDAHYSNMFLMYYHWYLEHMAIHLSKKLKCPFLNKTRKDTEKNYILPLVFDHVPDDLPEIKWPPLEPNFQGYQYHFAGFTFKLNKRSTHHTILQKVSKHILSDNKHSDLFDSWNSTGHYTLASATFFGCTLIHFVHITGRTSLDEDAFDEPVGYFACVFAAKGQLISQYGDLNAVSCLENNGVLRHWNDVSLCAQRRSPEEQMRETPCQIYYNTDEIRDKVKQFKLCPSTSSNPWIKIEAPHEHRHSIDVYFSDNDIIAVNITSREVHASLLTLKATPLIYFQTSPSVSSSSSKSRMTHQALKFTTAMNISVESTTFHSDLIQQKVDIKSLSSETMVSKHIGTEEVMNSPSTLYEFDDKTELITTFDQNSGTIPPIRKNSHTSNLSSVSSSSSPSQNVDIITSLFLETMVSKHGSIEVVINSSSTPNEFDDKTELITFDQYSGTIPPIQKNSNTPNLTSVTVLSELDDIDTVIIVKSTATLNGTGTCLPPSSFPALGLASAIITHRNSESEWDIKNTAASKPFKLSKSAENNMLSGESTTDKLENVEITYSLPPDQNNNAAVEFNSDEMKTPSDSEDINSKEKLSIKSRVEDDEEKKRTNKVVLSVATEDSSLDSSTSRFQFARTLEPFSKTLVTSPFAYKISKQRENLIINEQKTSEQRELEDFIGNKHDDAKGPENFLQWLSGFSNLGYFLIACPIFLILLVLLIRTHDY